MKILRAGVVALGLALVLAVSAARAGDEKDEKPAKEREVKLAQKVEEGYEERLLYEVSLQTTGDGARSDSIDLTLRRKVDAVEQGLSTRETMEIEKVVLNGSELPQKLTVPITRGKDRLAAIAPGGPEVPEGDPDDKAPELATALRRDPDGLARALAPRGAKKTGDEWALELDALLRVFEPTKCKLVALGSKATAKLVSLTGEAPEVALVSLDATLLFTRGDDKTVITLKVTGTLKGAADGSAPPTKEQLTLVVTREGDDAKTTITSSVERTRLSAEKKPDESKADAKKDDGAKPADEKKPAAEPD